MDPWNKILVIGVGLIGGSLASAIKKNGLAKDVVGAGRSEQNLRRAVELECIDRFTLDFTQELHDSEIVVVATPVLVTEKIFEMIATGDYANAIITDVGSVKGQIVRYAQQHFAPEYRKFVPAHPIAGREHSGVEAATADLYHDKRTILTPMPRTDPDALEAVSDMWRKIGSRVSEMEVSLHDDLVAASSHLPHLVAFSLVNYIAHHHMSEACFELAASGFYDFTRIASSDPQMWHDISMANSDAITRELKGYVQQLESTLKRIGEHDSTRLVEIFESAKATRDQNLNNWLNSQSLESE